MSQEIAARQQPVDAAPRLVSVGDTPLRILFCTYHYFPAPAGGAERQARLQAEELVRRGHRVTVFSPRVRGFRSGIVNGVDVRRLPLLNVRRFRRVTYLAVLGLNVLFRGRRFDLIHVHLANLQADVIVPIARVMGVPTYVKVACGGQAGEVGRLRPVAWATRRIGLRGATRVQALSTEIRDELLGIGVRPDRIASVRNGLDIETFRPAGREARRELRSALELPQQDVLVLFIGRFARYKGLLDLLEVWDRLDQSGATLVLVGTQDTPAAIGAIAARQRVIVRDWSRSVHDYLRASDVFVYPSYTDGMSNAVIEAMACGLALVASRSGATAELVVDEEAGLLFDAGDQTGLSSRLHRAIRDPALRARLGEQARRAVEPLSIERIVDEVEAAYEHCRTR